MSSNQNYDSSHDEKTVNDIATAVIRAIQRERLMLKEAVQIITRGEEMAAAIGIPMVITVVDDGGNLIVTHRMDDSLLAGIDIAFAKAYTAVALRQSTAKAAGSILPGQSLYGLQQTHPGKFCLFGGGIPIIRDGHCIGAVGVSGGSVEQDTAVASYAAGL